MKSEITITITVDDKGNILSWPIVNHKGPPKVPSGKINKVDTCHFCSCSSQRKLWCGYYSRFVNEISGYSNWRD